MKFSNVLFALALFISVGIGFSSCSEDEPVVVNDLIGTWTMTAMDYDAETTIDAVLVSTTTTYVGTASNINTTLTFADEPNSVSSAGTYDLDLEATTAGQTQNLTWAGQPFLTAGTWTESGNTITITNAAGDTNTFTVIEKTATSLKLTWDYTTVETQTIGPITTTTTTNVETTITFTK